jgi:chromosome partitioning protein
MTRILTIANQKGGVGKTTTTVNVAAALAQSGHRVLVVDLDPQGNASTALGIEHAAGTLDVYDVITDDVPLVDIVTECPDIPGLWGAPATVDLAGAEIELVGAERREYRLKGAIEQYLEQQENSGTQVDYVLIDCPPSLGLLTVNGLVAAREVLLPIQCEYYALEGLSQLLRTVDMVAEHLNPELHVSAIVLTMYDGRTRLASQVAYEVRTHFGARVLDTVVPRSVRVSEAPSHGLSVISYDPTNSGAIAYREVAEQLDAIGPGTPTLTAKEAHG